MYNLPRKEEIHYCFFKKTLQMLNIGDLFIWIYLFL